MKVLVGRTALITGGASGIGLALAEAFAAEHMNIVLVDVEADALEAAVAKMRATGAACCGAQADVSDLSALRRATGTAVDAFGALHVLCNNAGVNRYGPITELEPSDWEWVLRVNLFGVINGVQAGLPHILAHGEGGHVVNTASVAGLTPLAGIAPYVVSKFGVVGLSDAMRVELAPQGVGVTVLCPGPVDTRIAASARNRPVELATSRARPRPEAGGAAPAVRMSPEAVAKRVVRGIVEDEPYIVTHPEYFDSAKRRWDLIEHAFRVSEIETAELAAG